MQKTHAGQSCPLGPRTIPGGTSPSSFFPPSDEESNEEEEVFEERSTGCWLEVLEGVEGEGRGIGGGGEIRFGLRDEAVVVAGLGIEG